MTSGDPTTVARCGYCGKEFDVREFHNEVLKDGAVPLAVLEQKIDRWIASKKG